MGAHAEQNAKALFTAHGGMSTRKAAEPEGRRRRRAKEYEEGVHGILLLHRKKEKHRVSS
jgi:hypothetical protein